MYADRADPTLLSPTGGLVTLLVWVAVGLVVAAVLLERRDA